MNKINAKVARTVRRRTKAKQVRRYEGALFSIDSKVYKAFKGACDKDQLKYSSVVEEFMRFYVETSKT